MHNCFLQLLTSKTPYLRYENLLREYSKRKYILVIATIGTFTSLLISILLSLVGLARISVYNPITDTYAPFGVAVYPMFFLVGAVIILVYALVGLPMGPPESNKKIKQTTLQK